METNTRNDMKKIIEQDLTGAYEDAQTEAQYTWKENEIAWYFCTTYCDVFKVQFTGKHWLSGNKWRYNKIYQYKYLESSGNLDFHYRGKDGISHDEEGVFYTTKKEAIVYGIAWIKARKADALEKYKKDFDRLKNYK